MPHTSRKKEPRYTKQRKVEGEDGWTHISSDSPSKARPRVSSYDDYHADMKAKGYEPYTLQWDHGGCSMFTVTPEPADAAMADENLWSQYRVVEEKWKRSESCKVLISVLRERILLAETAISTCVCFGTGTFSGYRDKWIARHDVALTQLIAFKTVVDTIEQVTGRRPSAFAQEPHYNDFDRRLLASLHITKVDHPTAFCLLTPESFAYCPGAEQNVVLRTLMHDPAILMGSDLSFYDREDGRTCAQWLSRSMSVEPWVHESELISASDAENREDLPQEVRARAREMLNEICQDSLTVKHYRKNKLSVQLPDLDAKDYPFYEQHLHWRSPTDESGGDAIPWPTML